MTKEALKLALEALEALELVNIEFVCGNGSHNAKTDRHEWDEPCPITDRWREAITAIKEALAQPEQEPVAFCDPSDPDASTAFSWPGTARKQGHTTSLHTTPPQRKPLTDEEIYMHCPTWLSQEQCKTWVRQIEAKLKEKNT